MLDAIAGLLGSFMTGRTFSKFPAEIHVPPGILQRMFYKQQDIYES